MQLMHAHSAVFTYGQSGHVPRAYQLGGPTLEYNTKKY